MTDTDWGAALHALDCQLRDLERRLDDDSWDDPVEVRVQHLRGAVPAAYVDEARGLAQRLTTLERRMVAELTSTQEELAGMALRRSAARNYHRSDFTASVGRGTAD